MAEGSNVDDVLFRVSDYSGEASSGRLTEFEVWRRVWIDGRAQTEVVWKVVWPGWRMARLAEIRYGDTPPGFEEMIPAVPLETGRYFASAGGKGVDFEVLSDASVLATSDIEGRYGVSGLRDAEVASLVERLSSGLRDRNADAVADLVLYPLRVNQGGETIEIRDRVELISSFDSLFTSTVVEAVLSSDPLGLFASYHGVMIGSGEVWLGGHCGDEPTMRCEPKVVAINRK